MNDSMFFGIIKSSCPCNTCRAVSTSPSPDIPSELPWLLSLGSVHDAYGFRKFTFTFTKPTRNGEVIAEAEREAAEAEAELAEAEAEAFEAAKTAEAEIAEAKTEAAEALKAAKAAEAEAVEAEAEAAEAAKAADALNALSGIYSSTELQHMLRSSKLTYFRQGSRVFCVFSHKEGG